MQRPITFEAEDMPDLTPLAGVALTAFAIFLAVTIGGSLGAAWETVMLWSKQVSFAPDGAQAVVDPIFGRDIGFFLFELPFLRLVQGLFNGLVVATLIVVLVRYVIGATRGGLVFATPVRMHLAVLGGLFLLSVAFGYQLDKYELVYSTRGVATGVSFTDQNAQFFAFDLLTVISGLAAAFLVGGALTRLHLAARADAGRLVPGLDRRRAALPGGRSSGSRSCRTSSPRRSATSGTTSR